MASQQPITAHRFIRRTELEKIIGLSRSAIYAKLDPKSRSFDASFPRSVRLGGGISVAWLENEVQEWIQSRISLSRAGVQ